MKICFAVSVVLAMLLSTEGMAKTEVPKTKNPFIPLVVQLYDNLEYDAALSTLQKASNWPNNTSEDLLWIEMMEGMLQYGAGNEANALASFKRALLLNRDAQLPSKGSPALRALFAKARSELNLPPLPEATLPSFNQQPVTEPKQVEGNPALEPSVSPSVAGRPVRASELSLGIVVGLRGEADILGKGVASAVTTEVGRGPFSGALTVLIQRSPGVRAEGRLYFLEQRVRPYFALGVTSFFPDTAGRVSTGLVLAVGSVHFSVDAAYERVFNPSISYSPNVVLVSLGAGWHFTVRSPHTNSLIRSPSE